MRYVAPDYYPQFRCIAGECRHNCCIGWEIDIDDDTLALYQSIGGELGERLQKNICTTDDPPHFILAEHERCPFLNKDNLCDLIIAQGESALCQICDDHPRFYNEWANFTEMGLGLCCEAAGRLILSRTEPVQLVTIENDGAQEAPDQRELHVVVERGLLFMMLQRRELPLEKRLTEILKMSEISLPTRSFGQWAAFYQSLEQLDPAWTAKLEELKKTPLTLPKMEWDVVFEQITHYFLYRHIAGALEEDEIRLRTAFAVLSVWMIRALCGVILTQKGTLVLEDVADIARMYSSEVEYSDENMDALLQEIADN